MPMVAWYMLSKESYMNRVMREVLPTVEERVSWDSGKGGVGRSWLDEITYHSVRPRRQACGDLVSYRPR